MTRRKRASLGATTNGNEQVLVVGAQERRSSLGRALVPE
jgi:hypothetical protein